MGVNVCEPEILVSAVLDNISKVKCIVEKVWLAL